MQLEATIRLQDIRLGVQGLAVTAIIPSMGLEPDKLQHLEDN